MPCATIDAPATASASRRFRAMFTAQLAFGFDWGRHQALRDLHTVGDRPQDQSGLQQLGSYAPGILAWSRTIGDHWEFAVRGTNMTNELGMTESNCDLRRGVHAGGSCWPPTGRPARSMSRSSTTGKRGIARRRIRRRRRRADTLRPSFRTPRIGFPANATDRVRRLSGPPMRRAIAGGLAWRDA